MNNNLANRLLGIMLILIIFCLGGLLLIFPFSLNSIFVFIYLVISILLLQIVNSSKNMIFIKENVKRFKYIGICLFICTIVEYVLSLATQHTGTRLIDLAPGIFITFTMGVYIVSSLLCFVISDAFKRAIEIKEDNDLTI